MKKFKATTLLIRHRLTLLPEFPRTFHFPGEARADGDPIATNKELNEFKNYDFIVEEKIDGSNLGICLVEGYPIARGRKKFIHKGETKKNTSAKQFASFWNWFYENKNKFQRLDEIGPFSIYGEWLVAQHGMFYNALPCYFMAFDLYDYEKQYFVNPLKARKSLEDCGIDTVPRLNCEKIDEYILRNLTEEKSEFSDSPREGVYIKFFDKDKVVARYKLVRRGFVQGNLWDNKNLKKNLILTK